MIITNEILVLSIALLMLGMSFPAYTNFEKSNGFNNPASLWFIATLTQFLSSASFASYQFTGAIAFSLGSTLQFTTDILLGLLFRAMHKKVTLHAYLLMAAVTLSYWIFYDHEEYVHRTIIASAGLTILSVWQIRELLNNLKKGRSKYIIFLITIISIQTILASIRLRSGIDLLPLHDLPNIPQNRFQEDLDTFLIRMPILLIYVLIFMGIGNHFFENLWRQAHSQRKALEEQVTVVLTKLAAARDNNTGKHILRTQRMIKLLAEALRDFGFYRDFLTHENIRTLYQAAPLHDVGKIAIPDEILLKPRSLNAEERRIIEKHALLGEQILSTASTTGHTPILEMALKMAGSHHEHCDGTGYPRGLKENEIPLEGRIMAIVDVYDALTTERIYKEKWDHEEVVDMIKKNKGKHFDSIIVEAFLAVSDEFKKIAEDMKDPDLGVDIVG